MFIFFTKRPIVGIIVALIVSMCLIYLATRYVLSKTPTSRPVTPEAENVQSPKIMNRLSFSVKGQSGEDSDGANVLAVAVSQKDEVASQQPLHSRSSAKTKKSSKTKANKDSRSKSEEVSAATAVPSGKPSSSKVTHVSSPQVVTGSAIVATTPLVSNLAPSVVAGTNGDKSDDSSLFASISSESFA